LAFCTFRELLDLNYSTNAVASTYCRSIDDIIVWGLLRLLKSLVSVRSPSMSYNYFDIQPALVEMQFLILS